MNTPREMFIEGILGFNYLGNCRKRVDRIDRLAAAIGAKVSWGINTPEIRVEMSDGSYYEISSTRQTERLLRHLRRTRSAPGR